jgi:beta-lactamase regulating signal transducer with metallopeptidase domain
MLVPYQSVLISFHKKEKEKERIIIIKKKSLRQNPLKAPLALGEFWFFVVVVILGFFLAVLGIELRVLHRCSTD